MRVVMIDFNTMMYPCIKLYDHLVTNPNENSTVLWNALEHDFEIERHLSIDVKVIMEIAKFIRDYRDSSEIVAIENSMKIISYLDDVNEKIDFIHMGYHHNFIEDVHIEIPEITIFHDYTDKNWLGYMIYHNMIERVRWIKCPNSPSISEEVEREIKKYTDFSIHPIKFLNELESSDEAKINEKLKIDRIILYANNLYVPYKYRYICDLICECFHIPMMN